MDTWDVMRQDDLGNAFRVAAHDSRISALAQVMVLESGVRHRQMYWVDGPPGPAVRTNRDLYLVFLQLGQEARAASWSLSAFLRSLWKVGATLAGQAHLEPDDVAAMFAAAATTPPAAFDPAWSGEDLSLPGDEPDGYADWERVLLSQIADLEDFLSAPRARGPGSACRRPGRPARAPAPPRPAGTTSTRRRTWSARWRAASAAGTRPTAPACPAGPGEQPARSYVRTITTMSWADLARIAVCGQVYE
ncbi:hypothetical protein ACFQY7_13650 [Actinomadura luteofluorescens]|uniref:hypothetical protein n=1 Tax=Actinomadura luteofluorescens TaxID=46163 RepID=UPI003636B911